VALRDSPVRARAGADLGEMRVGAAIACSVTESGAVRQAATAKASVEVYASAVNGYIPFLVCFLLAQASPLPKARREFHWDWHQSQLLFQAPTLKDSKLRSADSAELASMLEKEIRASMDVLGFQSESQVEEAAWGTHIKLINLSQNGGPQIVLQTDGFCSGDGNCELTFRQKAPRGYRLLLDAIGQSFNIQKTKTNGFSDLVVNMHSSATDLWLKVYRYARGRYWRTACYDANWAPLENGVVHHLKEPRITPTSCGK
jgi:hypothetical protein